MLTWTERRAIDHAWASAELAEQITHQGIKKTLNEHAAANILVIQERLWEIARTGK